MTKSKELILGMQHIRIGWFLLQLQYLKALMNIWSLIHRLRDGFKK